MITLRRHEERGHANHGWLDTYHTFSFADYHDPAWMGFRTLRVINDDLVMPGRGFGMHPHRDMEIITYVLSGALEHRDSLGHGRVIRAGDVQYMSAGSGVRHSEVNPSPDEAVRLLQIWIEPDRRGLAPRYAEKPAAVATAGTFQLVASNSGRDGSIAIRQDADLWIGRFEPGQGATHRIAAGRGAWAHVAQGRVTINGQPLGTGDALALTDESEISLTATESSQVLVFDLK